PAACAGPPASRPATPARCAGGTASDARRHRRSRATHSPPQSRTRVSQVSAMRYKSGSGRGEPMTEPREIADAVEVVADGVWHWRVRNSNIGGGISSSHAVTADGGSILIDPVRLGDAALQTLPPVQAILLTATCHQRAAWRYRRELGAEVWLPEDG